MTNIIPWEKLNFESSKLYLKQVAGEHPTDRRVPEAARATLALNWALCFLRFLLISDPPFRV
jgi:hypothetical protein